MGDQDVPEGPEKSKEGSSKKGGGSGKTFENSKWKKGVSGHPEGRPKGTPNVRTAVNRVARSRVTVTENGVKKKMSALEAQIEMTKMRGLQGKGRSEALMLELYRIYVAEDELAAPQLGPEELKLLTDHIYLASLTSAATPTIVAEPDAAKPSGKRSD